MTFTGTQPSDTEIQSVVFRPDNVVEITYLEPFNQTKKAAKVEVLMFDASDVQDEVDAVRVHVTELLEKVYSQVFREEPDMVPIKDA